jgi:hypothetical protein
MSKKCNAKAKQANKPVSPADIYVYIFNDERLACIVVA